MRLSFVLAAVAVLQTAPAIARACSCGGDPAVLWPAMDANGIPTNTRIWINDGFSFYEFTRPHLRKAGETVDVDFTVSTIETSGTTMTVYTPDAALAPNTTYELMDCDSEMCEAPYVRFTTGAEPDLDPPAIPVETNRSGESGGSRRDSCGKYKAAEVIVDAEGLLVMEIDGGSLDPKTLSGDTTVLTLERAITVGSGACLMHWPTSDDTAPVRYAAFDLAGNFSGWTEPDSLTIGGGCSCRSDAPGAPPLLLLAVVALGMRRRR